MRRQLRLPDTLLMDWAGCGLYWYMAHGRSIYRQARFGRVPKSVMGKNGLPATTTLGWIRPRTTVEHHLAREGPKLLGMVGF